MDSIIKSYTNGNVGVSFNRANGNKVTHIPQDSLPEPEHPDRIFLKIVDFTCFRNARWTWAEGRSRKEANISDIIKVLSGIHYRTSIVLGGGATCEHTQLPAILRMCKRYGLDVTLEADEAFVQQSSAQKLLQGLHKDGRLDRLYVQRNSGSTACVDPSALLGDATCALHKLRTAHGYEALYAIKSYAHNFVLGSQAIELEKYASSNRSKPAFAKRAIHHAFKVKVDSWNRNLPNIRKFQDSRDIVFDKLAIQQLEALQASELGSSVEECVTDMYVNMVTGSFSKDANSEQRHQIHKHDYDVRAMFNLLQA